MNNSIVSQTKYGIKLAGTEYSPGKKKIIAITQFKSGNIPTGFIEITGAEYAKYTGSFGPFSYWDVADNDVKLDKKAEEAQTILAIKTELRSALKSLYFEIQFSVELGEDVTELENQYDALLIEYQSLIKS